MPDKKRVIIADDHSLVRDGISSLLMAAGYQVLQAVGDGEAAIRAVQSHRPDLVLLDLNMPRVNGLQAAVQIKAEMPETAVVILTVNDDDQSIIDAIKGGADGYLLKNLSSEAFLSALEALERGEFALSRKMTTRLIHGLVKDSQRPSAQAYQLTKREEDVLKMVAVGRSNREISELLALSESTVKYHLRKIMQKLNVANRTEAVTLALREGLIQNDE
jgi:DNA-binding NarL/FixJ family response regulator